VHFRLEESAVAFSEGGGMMGTLELKNEIKNIFIKPTIEEHETLAKQGIVYGNDLLAGVTCKELREILRF
jgi:hypothetical protein